MAEKITVEQASPAPKKEFQKKFDYQDAEKLLEVRHLKQYFRFAGGSGPNKYLKAVHDVSFSVYKGEVFGLVGESGCGKTTTGRDIMKLYKITSGDIWLEGTRIAAGTRWNEKEIKFTNIRLHDDLKRLKAEISEKQKDYLASYETKFGTPASVSLFNVCSGEDCYEAQFEVPMTLKRAKKELKNRAAPFYEEKRALYENYRASVAPLEEEIKSKKERAEGICSVQRDKIAQAKKDDRNYNKNIAAKEMQKVEEKYRPLLQKVEATSASALSEEELASYKKYKEEMRKAKRANLASKIQMIFQDPIASLNPRMTVRNIIAEGLIIQGCHDKEFINREVSRVLQLVGLVPEHANRYPHEFSGGQRQRIGIARAVIMNPELIVADEPVSALDVSVQAQVINLLNELRNSLGLTIIFIAHNLSVVKYFCDRIAVMYYGNLVELATSDELFAHPLHPYTKSLLSAVPCPDPITETNRQRIHYNPAESHDYSSQQPTFREIAPGHFVRCNDEEEARYLEELKK